MILCPFIFTRKICFLSCFDLIIFMFMCASFYCKTFFFSFSLHPILHPQTEDERDYNFVRLNWGQYMMFIEKVDSMHSYSWLEVLNLIKTELYFQFPFKCNHFGILLQCMMHLLSLPSNQLNNETIYAKSFVDVTETIKI